MSQHDPLRKNRLGLRGILLVSGGVLVASSVFFLPDTGLLRGSASTTDLAQPSLTAASGEGTDGPSDAAVLKQGTSTGPADAIQPLLPVYWLGEVEGTDRLFREFLVSPAGATGDPISEAVQVMTEGRPLDPDYHSPWRPASSVSSSISTKNVITLDISADSLSKRLDEDEARLALQQLVHTATAAAANGGLIAGGEASSVVVLVDGAANYRAFGAVDLGGEWTRDASALAPVWVIDPQEGVEYAAESLTIHGVGPATDDSLAWRIDRSVDGSAAGGTDLFRDGSVDISPQDGVPGAYSFSVTLPPGQYEITVSTPSGSGRAQDSKTITVR
jgi:hypothetical protein